MSRVVAALLVVVVAASFAATATAFPTSVYGGDVSALVPSPSARELVAFNLTFWIVRAYHSYGAPDTAAPSSIAAFHAGGAAHVDVYMFPCPKCATSGERSASAQVEQMLSALTAGGASYGMVWLDIEGAQYWSTSHAANQAFYSELLAASRARRPTGVYCSHYMWATLFGSDYVSPSIVPIWYPHYDGKPSFSDWTPFGGFESPNIKQFTPDVSRYGVGYDLNWYPPSAIEQRSQYIAQWRAEQQQKQVVV